MPRHDGPPYWRGGPAETYLRGMGPDYIARNCAAQMRELADAMPKDAPQFLRRRACLRARAAEIDAGQYNSTRHFRVIVPHYHETPSGRKTLRQVSYPCRGCFLYTFDEAWLLMEAFAAKRGWSDGHRMEVYAEGRGQNMALGYIYDGIAEPCREVPEGEERERPW
jgi:hypothetical protein